MLQWSPVHTHTCYSGVLYVLQWSPVHTHIICIQWMFQWNQVIISIIVCGGLLRKSTIKCDVVCKKKESQSFSSNGSRNSTVVSETILCGSCDEMLAGSGTGAVFLVSINNHILSMTLETFVSIFFQMVDLEM